MATAREHIRSAGLLFDMQNPDDTDLLQAAGVQALIAIAITLADMADMDADTRTQPAIKPPTPAPNYELFHPGDTERIPT